MLYIATTQAIVQVSLHNFEVTSIVWLHPDFLQDSLACRSIADGGGGWAVAGQGGKAADVALASVTLGTAGFVVFDACFGEGGVSGGGGESWDGGAGGGLGQVADGAVCAVASAFTASVSLCTIAMHRVGARALGARPSQVQAAGHGVAGAWGGGGGGEVGATYEAAEDHIRMTSNGEPRPQAEFRIQDPQTILASVFPAAPPPEGVCLLRGRSVCGRACKRAGVALLAQVLPALRCAASTRVG